MLRFFYLFLIICFVFTTPMWGNGDRYAQSSVLSEGRWVKIKVDNTGIYKLTVADLKKMGFSDISKVGVYGYGGWLLTENFNANDYIDDLPEVATWKGDGDFILFYAKGTVRWDYSSFTHERNTYSNSGYYFLHETDSPLRMESLPNATNISAASVVTTFDDFMLHETESASVAKSGRELFGESFQTKTSQDFTFSVPGITDDAGKISFRFISKIASGTGKVSLSVNNELLSNNMISSTNDSYTYALEANNTNNIDWDAAKSESVKINIKYEGASSHENIHLDYIRIRMKRELRPYGGVTFFRALNTKDSNASYIIQNGSSDLLVFDVTDGENPLLIETSLNGSELSFTREASGLREYALVQSKGTISTPEFVGEIKNQNLHALAQQDMIIIAPEAFTQQAERLAEEHRTRDGLTVSVVDPQNIYNEFSSSTPDATAYRRFMKMFYDRANAGAGDPPKYLLLFGDGSYDNRQLTNEWKAINMSNFLLTFQSQNSLNAGLNSGTFVTDDYFGFLDDHEGSSLTYDNVDIGIGRFPVRTSTQAKNAVDKVIAYMDNTEHGPWKNVVTFIGDDGNQHDLPAFTTLHMSQANELAEQITNSHPEFVSKKLFFDAHKKDNSSGGFATYPTIRSGLMQQLKEGTMLINYTGHGSKDSWSDEKVLIQSDITQFTYSALPLWITATCDFTPFDVLLTSAGEDVFLNPKSGGIALFTTMRVAYPSQNFNINSALIKYLFKPTDGVYPTLGETIMLAKRDLGESHQKLNFILIGDPALRLNYPTSSIRLTEINGKPIPDTPLIFSALQKVTVKGVILNPDGSKDTGFNGEINPTVFDSWVKLSTLNNNKTSVTPLTFTDYPNKLFVGNEDVKDGEFEFSFTVPIDLLYKNVAGKMNLYAVDYTTQKEANGSFSNYNVGGTSGDIEETEGPEVRSLYLNDSTFTYGGKVNSTPLLMARIWDAYGVNITGSSIGHDITLVIDGQSSLTYNLNAYYKTISGSDGEGLLQFSIPELSTGVHTAELKVWNILNQSTTIQFSFEVVAGLKPHIYEINATPSPARESVTFQIYHNRPESTVKVNIMIYDMMGKLQWKGEEQKTSNSDAPLTMEWNLQNGYGSRLSPGIYIYRAAISTNNSKEVTEAKKLLILAQ